MRPHSVALFTDYYGRAIEHGHPLWSSERVSWSGFPLERACVRPLGALKDVHIPEMLLALCVAGSANVELGSKPAQYRSVKPGAFALFDRGDLQKQIVWSGLHEVLYVRMTRVHLKQLVGCSVDSTNFSILPQYAVFDPQITRLILNMQDEVRAGCPTGPLYGESLSLSLASYVLGRYSQAHPPAPRTGTVFSSRQMSEIREYLHANLKRNIALSELAQLVGMSCHYFSRLFKSSFGIPPHRYLLIERIRAGAHLLARSELPVCEIALELGFSDQSHFTQAFRKLIGTTPRRYRRACVNEMLNAPHEQLDRHIYLALELRHQHLQNLKILAGYRADSAQSTDGATRNSS